MATKASDLFVQALLNEGVDYVFGVPGEENLDLLESIRASPLQLILSRHEQGAGFMAATCGRLTGKAGVCLATLGPGATNLMTAAAYAQLGAMPMLMVTGQKPIKKSKQGRFQIVDVVGMMRPVTKYARQIVNGASIPISVREAFRLAEEERPGAAHLELPEDVAAETVDEPQLFTPSSPRRPVADAKALVQGAEMIAAARRPLLLIGAGANRKRINDALGGFLDRLRIPFINTQMGKGVVDKHSRFYIGTAALSDGDFVHRAFDCADLIINVGHDVVEKPPFFMRRGGAEVIHVNFSSAAVDEVYFPQLELIGDIASTLQALTGLVAPAQDFDLDRFARIRDAALASSGAGGDDGRFPLAPQRLVAEVRAAMPEDGIVALDNGLYKIWFARNYRTRQPNTLLLDNALATMGAGLPSAMAAALLYPGRRVLAVCGDGGFMMNSQELETAVRLGLNLAVLVLRDDAYGMIRWKQTGMDLPDWGLQFGNPDFVAYAGAYGARGHRLDAADALRPLLASCFDAGGVHLIDTPVDYGDSARLLNETFREQASRL